MALRRILIAAIALAAVALFTWQFRRAGGDAPRVTAPDAEPPPPPPVAKKEKAAPPPAQTERSPLADALNSPASDIRADLRLVSSILETFRTNFPKDGNPVGTNADITAALTGRNRLGFAPIPPDHKAINRDGELCDRWGTPFFFHAESAVRMEIRSAGPDKKMWTADDVSFSP